MFHFQSQNQGRSGGKLLAVLFSAAVGAFPLARAQLVSPQPLGDGPWEIQTYQAKITVSEVARGISHPLEQGVFAG